MRFFILNGHYRSPLNFSRELMQSCQNGLDRIKNCRKDLVYYIDNCKEEALREEEKPLLNELEGYKKEFETAMDDDFNTADAITAIYELVRFANVNAKGKGSKEFCQKVLSMFDLLTGVLGIIYGEDKVENDQDVALIEELIAKRADAKKNKDFAQADKIRDELSAMGITIKDTREGVQWFRG